MTFQNLPLYKNQQKVPVTFFSLSSFQTKSITSIIYAIQILKHWLSVWISNGSIHHSGQFLNGNNRGKTNEDATLLEWAWRIYYLWVHYWLKHSDCTNVLCIACWLPRFLSINRLFVLLSGIRINATALCTKGIHNQNFWLVYSIYIIGTTLQSIELKQTLCNREGAIIEQSTK